MIYVKHFQFGEFQVSIVPRRHSFDVVCLGYKSPRFNGWDLVDWQKHSYHVFKGTLSECNDIFNSEVSYLCAMYDEEIYQIADVKLKKDVF